MLRPKIAKAVTVDSWVSSHFSRLSVLAILGLVNPSLSEADIEPRSYSNIPVGFNFLLAGYAYQSGNVAFAPSIPIKNGKLQTNSTFLAYVRALDIWGKSGKVDVIIPEAWLSGEAEVLGKQKSREVSGFADPTVRFYVNLFGAPALSPKEFAAYKQDTIVGVSLAVTAPGGQYDPQKLVNIGTNRWSFKPEIGISKAWGALITEVAAGAYVFTDNNQPYQGKTLAQSPMYSFQGHFIYNFTQGIWGALDANYYTGARTITDQVAAENLQQNWRVGATLAFPINRQHSIKLNGSTGVYSRTGSSFDTYGIAWQYRWGPGL
jgi:hypothetical protein